MFTQNRVATRIFLGGMTNHRKNAKKNLQISEIGWSICEGSPHDSSVTFYLEKNIPIFTHHQTRVTKIGLISHLGESIPKTSCSGKIPYHAAIGMGIPHLVTVHHPTSVLHSVQRRHPHGPWQERVLSFWEGCWKVWR